MRSSLVDFFHEEVTSKAGETEKVGRVCKISDEGQFRPFSESSRVREESRTRGAENLDA